MDRIVLYIDDLDRCNEEVVVKVLEAIHLLLAFELFVVVVGVDPRWMHNALENKYSKQLKNHNGIKPGHNENETDAGIDSATSYDYLEKIFQIPLSLNEIDPEGKSKLIDENLKIKEQKPKEEKKIIPDGTETTVKLNGEDKKAVGAQISPSQPDTKIEITNQQEKEKRKMKKK